MIKSLISDASFDYIFYTIISSKNNNQHPKVHFEQGAAVSTQQPVKRLTAFSRCIRTQMSVMKRDPYLMWMEIIHAGQKSACFRNSRLAEHIHDENCYRDGMLVCQHPEIRGIYLG